MSGGEGEPKPEEAADVGESQGMSERTAKILLGIVGVGVAWAVLAVAPWLAYVVLGIMLDRGVLKLRAWRKQRYGEQPDADAEEEQDVPAPLTEDDVIEALHEVAAPHAFLADVAAELGLPTHQARAVLEELEIPIRRAVRNGEDTGVGVHRADLPPLPRRSPEGAVDGVDQGQPTNQHGVRVEKRDGGLVIYDLADTHRHHRVK